MASEKSNRVAGEFRWLSQSVLVNVPDRKLLDRLGYIVGLEPFSTPDNGVLPDIVVVDERHVRCRENIKVFHSINDLLIWSALTTSDLLAQKNQLLLMHAATWLVDKKVVLLFGEPRNGKSSLSMIALENGISILGDDVVLVDPVSGMVEATPRPPKKRLTMHELNQFSNNPTSQCSPLYGKLHGEPCVLTPRTHRGILQTEKPYSIKSIWFVERCGINGIRQSIPERFSALIRLLSYARDWSSPPLKSASAVTSRLLEYPSQLLEIGEGQLDEAFAVICGHEGF